MRASPLLPALVAAVLLCPALAAADALPAAAPAPAAPTPAAAAPSPAPLPLLTDDELRHREGQPLPPAPQVERTMRAPERLTQRPSGFWTPNRPAVGGSYRYDKLIVGLFVLLLTGLGMVYVVRKHARRPA